MARLGDLVIGGRSRGQGVAFNLNAQSVCSFSYSAEGWNVQLREGYAAVVAVTTDELGRDDLLSQGMEQCQRCLDMLAIKHQSTLLLAKPGGEHIIVFIREGRCVIQHSDISYLTLFTAGTGHVQMPLSAGEPAAPEISGYWSESARFYRLSQASTDLYESYRNLWLGFEALLSEICPIDKSVNEGEKRWLKRALRTVASLVNLPSYLPQNCGDPIEHLVRTQYEEIRCQLFHAKHRSNKSPLDAVNPERILIAYEVLLHIWRDLIQVHAGLRLPSGGMTHTGFRLMMDATWTEGMQMVFTSDQSPFTDGDVEASPKGLPTFPFTDVKYLGEVAPGKIELVARTPIVSHLHHDPVHRICLVKGGVVQAVSVIPLGLTLDDADDLESRQMVRLTNRGLPRSFLV